MIVLPQKDLVLLMLALRRTAILGHPSTPVQVACVDPVALVPLL